MTQLVAFLSSGKGSWLHVSQLIKQELWEKVFLITNCFGKEKFSPEENTEILVFDLRQDARVLSEQFFKALKGKLRGFEVAVNLISGSGEEHMALLSSLIKLGVGFRLVVSTSEGIKEL